MNPKNQKKPPISLILTYSTSEKGYFYIGPSFDDDHKLADNIYDQAVEVTKLQYLKNDPILYANRYGRDEYYVFTKIIKRNIEHLVTITIRDNYSKSITTPNSYTQLNNIQKSREKGIKTIITAGLKLGDIIKIIEHEDPMEEVHQNPLKKIDMSIFTKQLLNLTDNHKNLIYLLNLINTNRLKNTKNSPEIRYRILKLKDYVNNYNNDFDIFENVEDYIEYFKKMDFYKKDLNPKEEHERCIKQFNSIISQPIN